MLKWKLFFTLTESCSKTKPWGKKLSYILCSAGRDRRERERWVAKCKSHDCSGSLLAVSHADSSGEFNCRNPLTQAEKWVIYSDGIQWVWIWAQLDKATWLVEECHWAAGNFSPSFCCGPGKITWGQTCFILFKLNIFAGTK